MRKGEAFLLGEASSVGQHAPWLLPFARCGSPGASALLPCDTRGSKAIKLAVHQASPLHFPQEAELLPHRRQGAGGRSRPGTGPRIGAGHREHRVVTRGRTVGEWHTVRDACFLGHLAKGGAPCMRHRTSGGERMSRRHNQRPRSESTRLTSSRQLVTRGSSHRPLEASRKLHALTAQTHGTDLAALMPLAATAGSPIPGSVESPQCSKPSRGVTHPGNLDSPAFHPGP